MAWIEDWFNNSQMEDFMNSKDIYAFLFIFVGFIAFIIFLHYCGQQEMRESIRKCEEKSCPEPYKPVYEMGPGRIYECQCKIVPK
jgi:heme/copper-type cytochrome/quinol oxidase subunit 1